MNSNYVLASKFNLQWPLCLRKAALGTWFLSYYTTVLTELSALSAFWVLLPCCCILALSILFISSPSKSDSRDKSVWHSLKFTGLASPRNIQIWGGAYWKFVGYGRKMARAPGREYLGWINHQFWRRPVTRTCPQSQSLTHWATLSSARSPIESSQWNPHISSSGS